ncbi:MAG: HAD family hydrolase [Candidatus Njordarchaeales archaeon]
MLNVETVLLDLDGTLGHFEKGDLGKFVAELYAEWLSEHFSVSVKEALEAIFAAVTKVKVNPTLEKTVAEQMLETIAQKLRVTVSELDIVTNKFYEERFDLVREGYVPVEGAEDVVEYLFKQGYKVAIATDPIVKKIGVLKRLEWIHLHHYPYCFIAGAEVCRAAKPHSIYYLDILEHCNSVPEKTVMVGDKIVNDILPAKKLGINTIYVSPKTPDSEEEKVADLIISSIRELTKVL